MKLVSQLRFYIARIAILLIIVVLNVAMTATHATTRKPFPVPIRAILDMNYIQPTRKIVSAGKKFIAYTLCSPKKQSATVSGLYTQSGIPATMRSCTVQLTDLQTGESSLVSRQGSSFGGVWSPDGRLLAFVSDRDGWARIWIWKKGKALHRITQAVVVGQGDYSPVWTSNSCLVTTALPVGHFPYEYEHPFFPAPRRKLNGASYVSYYYSGKFPGTSVALSYNQFAVGVRANILKMCLSPSDTQISTLVKGISIDSNNEFVVAKSGNAMILPLESSLVSGTSQRLTSRLYYATISSHHGQNSVSPFSLSYGARSRVARLMALSEDGNTVVAVDTSNQLVIWQPKNNLVEHFSIDTPLPSIISTGWLNPDTLLAVCGQTLCVYSILTKKYKRIGNFPQQRIQGFLLPSPEAHLPHQAVQRAVVFLLNEQTQDETISVLDLQSGQILYSYGGDWSLGSFPQGMAAFADGGKSVVAYLQKSSRAPDFYLLSTHLTRVTRLTNLNPDLNAYAFGKSRLLIWRDDAGFTRQAAVLLPVGYKLGVRYPTIIVQYPGAIGSNFKNLFGLSPDGDPTSNMQIFATRDYAVVWVDTNQNFHGLHLKEYGAVIASAVNAVVRTGIADPRRIGIMGHSHGGWGVLAALESCDCFRAAMVSAPVVPDLIATYGLMYPDGTAWLQTWSENGFANQGGDPWSHQQAYLENSPVLHLDRIRASVLIIKGALDVAPEETDALFVDLRRLGREVKYVKYYGEGHNESKWGYANQLNYLQTVVDWFDQHMK